MNLLITLLVFLIMEPITWMIHKYIMHGLLWSLHKDHHDHSHQGVFEKNDYFFFIFSLPAILLFYWGTQNTLNYLFFIGLGITLYGIAYFFIHDIFIHQRIKMFKSTRSFYFLAIRRAHKQHHKHVQKENGECFGFLLVPLKYFKTYWNKS